MNSNDERELLRLFEQVLEQPETLRENWLQGQRLAPDLLARVRRLLARESTLGGFLEQPAPHAFPELLRLPEVGERVGQYQLLGVIQAGGMGVVYLARRADDVYQQQVAIKLVQPLHLAGSAEQRKRLIARFEEERSILAQLTHPNIARILDGGSTDSGIPYLVMEYVDGMSLTRYCDDHDLNVKQRLHLFCKVCDGVQDAHRHLIVHRDLKPDNILVGRDGEPRLLDFGIAKLLDPTHAGAASIERTSLVAMTPGYASPEQMRHEPITTRSDIYSLGVMLYQLLAGARPYDLDGLTAGETERVVCEREPEPMLRAISQLEIDPGRRRRLRGEIAGDLEKIVAKAMHKQADRRYGSAQELADDLRRHLEGRPVHAHTDSRLYRLRKFLQRHRLASAAAALSLAAIVVAAGIAFEQARQARQAAQDSSEMNQFLIDVLLRSDPGVTGEELTMGEALDAAAEQIDIRFGDRPALAADVRYAIGYSMLSRHRLEPAQRQLEQGQRDAEIAYGPAHAKTLGIQAALAWLYYSQGRVSDAIQLFHTVLDRLDESNQRNITLYAVTLNDLGVVYLERDDYEPAHRHIQQALNAVEAHGVPVSIDEHANIVSNLAQVLHGLEQLDAADAMYARAADLLSGAFPDGSRDIAILLNNRALLARDQGRTDTALELLRESVAMRKRVFHGDHPIIVFGLSNLARFALTVDRVELSLEAASEAVAMADRLFDHASEEHVLALASLSEAQLRANERLPALRHLQRAQLVLAQLAEPPQRLLDLVRTLHDDLCPQPDSC